MNKQELTISYTEKIASLFSDIELSGADIKTAFDSDENINKKDISELINFEKLIADYAEENSYNKAYSECFAFVKEHLEESISAFNFHKDEFGATETSESVDTYMSHKDDDDFYELTISDLAFWLIYDTQKYAADLAIPKAQKLLDEYWAEVAKLETEKTK